VVNVEAQQSDQSSLLHWTRNMIALRKLFQVFGRGTLTFLNPANRKVLAYLRDLERPDGSHETVLCVANLSRFAQPASLDLALFAGMQPVEMLGYVPFPSINETPYALTVAPYSFLWLELQPAAEVNELLPEPRVELAEPIVREETEAFDVFTGGWSGWLTRHGIRLLETVLPDWLPRQRWFGAKTRTIHSVNLLDWAELPIPTAHVASHAAAEVHAPGKVAPAVLFFEIQYGGGGSDLYQVPLAFSTGAEKDDIAANHSESVIATLDSPLGPAVLHDGTMHEDMRRSLLMLIEQNATLAMSTTRTAAFADFPAIDAATDNAANPDHQQPSLDTPVAPVPISAQPGEAAAPPRSSAPAPSAAQRMQPRESPSAGNPVPSGGRLDAHASSLFSEAHPIQHLTSRVGTAEQSNTSILYGQKLILKLFRRLQPGENPDVEIGRFLTEVARFPHIAPFMGEITITPVSGEATTAAMLQGLVANKGDGWEWFLDQFASFLQSVEHLASPPETSPPGFLNIQKPLPAVRENATKALEAAALLGRRTAELHLALSTPTQDQAFCAERFTSTDLGQDVRRIEAQLNQALETLKSRFSTLDDSTADLAVQFFSRRREMFARMRDLASLKFAGQRIRIHGDYHLGQTLRAERAATDQGKGTGDFVILDFEGEPARTLAERRQKQSALKDVAGMIRSFSYAAHSGLDRYLNEKTGANADQLAGWARCWEHSAASEFLRSYIECIAAKPELLPPKEQAQTLLDAYVLEKALYELMYELNNRPKWIRIPFAGILAL
ncbi:MAG: alpha-glucosidase C-terminal domain-containing protein, partial [Terracidiphilus sp.]